MQPDAVSFVMLAAAALALGLCGYHAWSAAARREHLRDVRAWATSSRKENAGRGCWRDNSQFSNSAERLLPVIRGRREAHRARVSAPVAAPGTTKRQNFFVWVDANPAHSRASGTDAIAGPKAVALDPRFRGNERMSLPQHDLL
ncbi:MAG: hypothetical protein P8Y53_25735 [Pseudolabrys sp.]